MRKILAVVLLFIGGCSAVKIHPGTANAFDSAAYDTLSVTDNVIQSTKTALAANQFPVSIAGNVKTALNILITAYNTADNFYCGAPIGSSCQPNSYHTMANLGTATPAQQTQLTTLLNSVTNDTTALTAAKGTN